MNLGDVSGAVAAWGDGDMVSSLRKSFHLWQIKVNMMKAAKSLYKINIKVRLSDFFHTNRKVYVLLYRRLGIIFRYCINM